MTHPTRLTGPLTHTYRVTPGRVSNRYRDRSARITCWGRAFDTRTDYFQQKTLIPVTSLLSLFPHVGFFPTVSPTRVGPGLCLQRHRDTSTAIGAHAVSPRGSFGAWQPLSASSLLIVVIGGPITWCDEED